MNEKADLLKAYQELPAVSQRDANWASRGALERGFCTNGNVGSATERKCAIWLTLCPFQDHLYITDVGATLSSEPKSSTPEWLL